MLSSLGLEFKAVLLIWLEQFDELTIVDGNRGKSKKEQWFFAKVKSLIELELWKEARVCALEAITAI